jgi:heme oxygenase
LEQSTISKENIHGNTSALSYMYGGNHYSHFAIQPAEFCYYNNIPYLEATAIKYLCRHRNKNKLEDLKKAIHFIEMLIEFEYSELSDGQLTRFDNSDIVT